VSGAVVTRIARRRIRSLHPHLLGVPRDTLLVPGITDPGAHRARLRELGFPERLEPGQVLLPAVVGPRSRFNADGAERVHRDRPKELVSRLAWGRWLERHGPDQREIRGVRPWNYECFPRTPIPAPEVELRVVALAGDRAAVVAGEPGLGEAGVRLLHAVNLMLELFGACELLAADALSAGPPPTRLNWEVHPAAGLPQVPPPLEGIVGALPMKDRRVAEYRIARVGELSPDSMVVGRGGFRGYAVFGFADRGRFVVENLYHGNETLVTDRDWDDLSRLGKGGFLRPDDRGRRIAHSRGWESRLREAVGS
jgi:hypothetical protein